MKKEYKKPIVEEYEMSLEEQILAGADTIQGKGEGTRDDFGDARRYSTSTDEEGSTSPTSNTSTIRNIWDATW